MAVYAASFFIFLLCCLHSSKTTEGWVQSGYWYSGSGIPVSDINSDLFTHLICSFAHINSTSFELSINSSDVANFRNFTGIVRRRNPRITTLLSIWGGGDDPAAFASWVGESSSRKSFVKSSIETARAYGFDGIDLRGFIPNGTTNMTNFSTLLKEWRGGVKSEAKLSGKAELFLTVAAYVVGSGSYPIDSMKSNLDWVHIVAYDYHLPLRERFIYPHAALFDPSSEKNSTDSCIDMFINRGFPVNKLVLGLPFHGYAWKRLENFGEEETDVVGSLANGPAFTLDGSMGYKAIKSYVKDNGYGTEPLYNSTYVVNIFVKGPTWINFDGPEVITRKVSYAKEKGLLGYNCFQVSNDVDWLLSRKAFQASGGRKHNRRLLLISATLVILLLCAAAAAAAAYCHLQRRESLSQGFLGAFERFGCNFFKFPERFGTDAPSLQVFTFAKLKAATSNFSSENKLGEGGFGPVYKGILSNTGQQIAVKRLSRNSSQGLEEFKNEVMLTARLQHVNLARLIGFCTDRGEKMLVYEYMPMKSLDFYLFDPVRRRALDWEKRINIIQGVTQGLLYLQEYSNFTIIHRDLKASNILLDGNMNPKISDFGMARIFRKNEIEEANTTRIVGTYGYVPPEYVRKGIYSMKYDVFSFGVLLLQIISCKRTKCYYGPNQNLNLLEYAYEMWRDGYGMEEFMDPSLDDSSTSLKLVRCMQVALLCVQEDPQDRPSVVEISSMLRNETMEITSPREPAFSIKKCFKEKYMEEKGHVIYSMNDVTVSDVDPR